MLGDHIVVGNNNGTLAVWDLDSKQMTVTTSPLSSYKQYFCNCDFGLEGLLPFLYQKNVHQRLSLARMCLGDKQVHCATSYFVVREKCFFNLVQKSDFLFGTEK